MDNIDLISAALKLTLKIRPFQQRSKLMQGETNAFQGQDTSELLEQEKKS